jgi:hypothetical protein
VLKNESKARSAGGESPGGGAPRPSDGDADNYVIRVFDSPGPIDAIAWNALLAAQPHPTPFMRHEYLAALHDSGSATPATGWVPCFLTLWQGDTLAAGCPLYLKDHSYGEYVFRLGLGKRLRPAWPGLLPESAGGGSVHTRARHPAAGA